MKMAQECGQMVHRTENPNGQQLQETVLVLVSNQKNACYTHSEYHYTSCKMTKLQGLLTAGVGQMLWHHPVS